MKQLLTQGIILTRTDFGEADRIITLLTPDHGKLRLMAKGVRRIKSKLAGGIELFSVSHITFIEGKGEVGTLISTRLVRHYGNIVKRIERVQLGYDLIKILNKSTEDEPEQEYFDLLVEAFEALDEASVSEELIRSWFLARLITLAGHRPNLQTTADGQALDAGKKYTFSFDDMAFVQHPDGHFSADQIKLLRLLFSPNQPKNLQNITNVSSIVSDCAPLIQTMAQTYLRL